MRAKYMIYRVIREKERLSAIMSDQQAHFFRFPICLIGTINLIKGKMPSIGRKILLSRLTKSFNTWLEEATFSHISPWEFRYLSR